MAVLATVVIPTPFTVTAFVSNVAEWRGKPIELIPICWDGAPCGLLLQTTDRDYVCYATGTSPLHAAHIAVHEIGHLVLGHGGSQRVRDPDMLVKQLPGLSPALIRRVLGPAARSQHHEREAETFATMVLVEAGQQAHRSGGPLAAMPGLHAAFATARPLLQLDGIEPRWCTSRPGRQ